MSDSAFDATGASLPFSARPQRDARVDSAGKEHVIDAMRGFAALLVAYFHCRQVAWVGMESFHHTVGHALSFSSIVAYLTMPIAWGSAGVPIFFVISGYCIHRGGALRLAQNPNYTLNTVNFWARRFARIYPVLLAALLLTFALDWVSFQLPPVNHKLREIGLHAFLVNLFSLQGVAGKTYGSNGALWTLSLEVQFYAIYPLLFALRRRLGMTPLLALVALVNIVSAYVLERHDLQFFTSYWFAWTLGAWIADVKARKAADKDARRASNGLYAVAAVLVALGCVAFRFGQYGAFQLWALGFAFYLYRALDRRSVETPLARVLSRFGDFSFSLYLIHLPIFVLLSSLLYRSALQLSIWPSFGFMLVAVPVAYVFYRLVELPAMKWSASLKPKSKARVAAARA
ncbi:acyltransferase family protein [Paraburkholderia phenazinium]|jgi:peptidoglycan/LPS O-acetylase OafA/YrhL|uniref:Peptidoglycan/LPS O-acetylase OafA/YrhL, contains acyltransferase and SGNH-hydrolase domains n=1 Tax=Paraburkholderia phenazinium TaxID=60549 RepID=A0A1N6KPZ7_9BURK|nr:acyltransferase [Paraburkholderia phenazinium]SIO58672.1 Peptidoglycan/LPS O-acetylase OafA/YrhL, contains acyltransferase and SGNH-hydrolase domains [Paraburkholderia phenazinium]